MHAGTASLPRKSSYFSYKYGESLFHTVELISYNHSRSQIDSAVLRLDNNERNQHNIHENEKKLTDCK